MDQKKQKSDYKIYMGFWPMSLSNNVETTNEMSDKSFRYISREVLIRAP